jgi:hypothetical protein
MYRWEEHKKNMEPKLSELTVKDEERRFESFLANAKLADARNAQEIEPVHGLTKFSSLTQGECSHSTEIDVLKSHQ